MIQCETVKLLTSKHFKYKNVYLLFTQYYLKVFT